LINCLCASRRSDCHKSFPCLLCRKRFVLAFLSLQRPAVSAGLWTLSLADGRSAELYRILQADGKRMSSLLQSRAPLAPLDTPHLPVFLDSLAGRHETLLVRKVEEFASEDVLKVWQWLTRICRICIRSSLCDAPP
jgi:hypothetical protein